MSNGMTTSGPRGRPLLAFGAVVVAWVSGRAVLWETPSITASRSATPFAAAGQPPRPAIPVSAMAATVVPPEPPYEIWRSLPFGRAMQPVESVRGSRPVPPGEERRQPTTTALNHAPQPEGPVPAALAGAPLTPALPDGGGAAVSRWSADGWMMLRPGHSGTGSVVPGSLGGTYGASQAGAVLRYRLAIASPVRPAAYLRATAALDGSRQRDLAAGLSARPIARVPVVAAVEMRITEDRFGSRIRPVAMMVAEPPPVALPKGLRGEGYLQAGYAGGQGATAFVDGQLRADSPVTAVGRAVFRAGGGVWGGAQKGASRIDVGPTASLGFPVSRKAGARVAVDWRFRIEGGARPASGPAFTLSAGF